MNGLAKLQVVVLGGYGLGMLIVGGGYCVDLLLGVGVGHLLNDKCNQYRASLGRAVVGAYDYMVDKFR